MNVNLFYLSPNTTGGWVTYTAHLAAGLQQLADLDPRVGFKLYKVGNRTELNYRPFGYGLEYRNLSVADASKVARRPGTKSLIVALQKNQVEAAHALVLAGAWTVVHDPAEFKHMNEGGGYKCFTIRKAVQRQLPESVFVPHPYKRRFPAGTLSTAEHHACSISRIDFDKNTTILLDANRELTDDSFKIRIHGFENRLYTKFKVVPHYPEWEQSKSHYPRDMDAAVDICHRHRWAVDMSLIKGDGGGTQYSFMEAWDAGCLQVVHRDWILPDDELVPTTSGLSSANCYTAATGKELAALLTHPMHEWERERVVKNTDKLLATHDPARVALQMLRAMSGGG